MKLLPFVITCILVVGCERSSNNDETLDGTYSLITDMSDFSVRQALHQDSIYDETLLTLKTEEKMSEEEAIKFLKSMIDSELLVAPQIIYYDNASKLQIKNVSYEEFKKYIEVIKAKNKLQNANQ